MEKNQNVGDVSGGVGSAETKDDKVAYETYTRVLDEVKSVRGKYKAAEEKLNEMQSKLKEVELKELEKKGEYDTILTELRTELKKKDEVNRAIVNKFAESSRKKALESKAVKLGCTNVNAFMRLVGDEINQVEVGENFEVAGESLEELIERIRKESDNAFFANGNIRIADGTPGVVIKEKPEKQKTKEELIAELKG
jgi:hypothetical protein